MIRADWIKVAVLEELYNWVEQRGSADIADNVRCALAILDENLEFIRDGITELSTSGRPRT
ncbi:hypothetical protein [Pseudomonas sp. HLT2-19-2]